jgi:hypothetical protein
VSDGTSVPGNRDDGADAGAIVDHATDFRDIHGDSKADASPIT